jgi:hypothetical protein
MQTILERFRPQRTRANQSIESTLGEYLRNVLRDNRRFAEAVAGDATSGNIPAEFQEFLQTLQEDLILAVRAYAVPEEEEESEGSVSATASMSGTGSGSWVPGEEEEESAVSIASIDAENGSQASSTGSTYATPSAPSIALPTAPTAETDSPSASAIPIFHHQRGQTLPSTSGAYRLGVSGGSDGVPRRLNFFRAHLFPSIGNGGERASDDDADAVVPSIFVGVRSVTHDPSMTTEDLVGHPGFPFLDGQVPEDEAPAEDLLSAASASAAVDESAGNSYANANSNVSPATQPQPRRTLRDRVRDRFAPRREPRPHAPLNTYLIYVIGGNYPRSHPVLAIPSLVSGGPLTAEDLALVSELLGPAKPPTATADEIARAGLAVIPGSEMADLVAKGTVLEASLERCMVCLADYEPEDECRVLKCRHAFHKECVDHWLSAGRNSCPACRTEAVDKTTSTAAAAAAETGATTATTETAVPQPAL